MCSYTKTIEMATSISKWLISDLEDNVNESSPWTDTQYSSVLFSSGSQLTNKQSLSFSNVQEEK